MGLTNPAFVMTELSGLRSQYSLAFLRLIAWASLAAPDWCQEALEQTEGPWPVCRHSHIQVWHLTTDILLQLTQFSCQGPGRVEAGGRHEAISGGCGEPEWGGPQPAPGAVGARHPAEEQAHPDLAAIEEHQKALELIMSKYRSHVTRLVNTLKPDLQTIKNDQLHILAEKTEKVC